MSEQEQPNQELTQEPQVPLPPVVLAPTALTPHEKKKQAYQRQLEDARMMEQLGTRIIKVKTRIQHRLGEHLKACGVNTVGHGRVVVAGHNADEAFVRCGEVIEKVIGENNPLNGDTIVELFKLQAVFNAQLLASGEAHLKADRQPDLPQKGVQTHQAFPPGNTTIAVQVNTSQPAPAGPPLLP